MLPYTFPKSIYNFFRTKSEEELDEEARIAAGKEPEEWEEYKLKMEAKMEQRRVSNRAKQMRRYMKKYG